MVDSTEIRLLRERIQRQRERLRRDEPVDEPVEPVLAEAVPPGAARPLAARRQTPSALGSLGRIVAEHPALLIGVGATILVAGPQRSIRVARRALRAAVFLVGAYRGASKILGLMPARQPAAGGGAPGTRPSADGPSGRH